MQRALAVRAHERGVAHYILLGSIAAASFALATSANARPVYTLFDPTGSTGTYATAINGIATIAGDWTDSTGISHGFVRTSDGTITSFDPPGSLHTFVTGLNNGGTVVGSFEDQTTEHGFLRAADGTITVFDAPGGTNTKIRAIDEHGDFTGSYYDSKKREHGFAEGVRGKFESFDAGPGGTFPHAMIDRYKIVGGSFSDGTNTHGFLRDDQGSLSQIDAPGATSTFLDAETWLGGPLATGYYLDSGGIKNAFIYDGVYGEFQVVAGTDTAALAITGKGVIVGFYLDARAYVHGFIRNPNGTHQGKITSFDPPGSSSTWPSSIATGNLVTGWYTDGGGVNHGFLRVP